MKSRTIKCFVNSSIASDWKSEYEYNDYDSMAVKLDIGTVKWLYIAVYKAPSQLFTGYHGEIEIILNNALCKMNIFLLLEIRILTFLKTPLNPGI